MSLSAKGRRAKGVRGEREVRDVFEADGFEVRGLEGLGDHLVVCGKVTLHLEVKRQEKLRILEWSKQAEAEAPTGCVPLVVYRPSAEPWRVSLPLSDLVLLLQLLR